MEKIHTPQTPKEDSSYAFFDKHAKEYVELQREFYSDAPDTGRIFFRESLSAGIEKKTIVDIGCGAGDDLIAYKELGAKSVIGIEPSLAMLEERKESLAENHPDIKLVVGEWEHIPLADASVDAVTARYSFHVLADFKTAFKEVARVLKKDGLFLIATPHPMYDAKTAKEQNTQPGEKIKFPIFDGKLEVKNPPHTMEEYISEECLEYFIVEENSPYSMHEDKNETDPTGLLLRLRRK
jgi:ubiquinone/menaquinone biosynthesis C-methylase UbiE